MKLTAEKEALQNEKQRTSYNFRDLNQQMRNLKADAIRNQQNQHEGNSLDDIQENSMDHNVSKQKLRNHQTLKSEYAK